MTYFHSAKKPQPNEIIIHIQRSAAQMPFQEIKYPEYGKTNMSLSPYFQPTAEGDTIFSVESSKIK